MRSLSEIFCEWDFDDEFAARQRRDERLLELAAAGYDCSFKDLHALHNGQRVFTLDARPLRLYEDDDGWLEGSELPARGRGRSVRAPRVRQSDRPKPKLGRVNRRTRQRVTGVGECSKIGTALSYIVQIDC